MEEEGNMGGREDGGYGRRGIVYELYGVWIVALRT